MRINIWSLASVLVLGALLLTTACKAPEAENTVQTVEETSTTQSEAENSTETAAEPAVSIPDPVSNDDGTMTYTVVIKHMQFFPKELTVNSGDKVIWINEGIVAHNVTEKDNAWASPEIAVGDSWESSPKESYDYFCSIHPTMTGSVTVK